MLALIGDLFWPKVACILIDAIARHEHETGTKIKTIPKKYYDKIALLPKADQ